MNNCFCSKIHPLGHPKNSVWKYAAAAKSLQSCSTLCNPIDGSPTGSAILGILQARTLEWVAIAFSNAWKWKVKVKSLSPVRLFLTPWTAAHQAPPSMGFFRQEYQSGIPLPSLHIVLLCTILWEFSAFITLWHSSVPQRLDLDRLNYKKVKEWSYC